MDVQQRDDADVEREANRRNGFTSFQQSRKKLLAAKSCTGVTEWLVLTMKPGPSRKRDQESRASTIVRLQILGGVRSGKPRQGEITKPRKTSEEQRLDQLIPLENEAKSVRDVKLREQELWKGITTKHDRSSLH